MHWLDERMKENGYRVCFMAEYFLPDVNVLKRRECNYHLKVLEQKDFANLYLPVWSNALCENRRLQNVDRILNEVFLYDLSEGKYKKRSGDYV